MKRIFALAALWLGLAALVAPGQARMGYLGEAAEITRENRSGAHIQNVRREAEASETLSSRANRSGAFETQGARRTVTIVLPVVMLADRPLE
ncbi:hypothetical protein [Croceicoccus naphthovorans]|nr:hypothetical protein [Croceicoccus naphthovorans]MBB3990837.1 hypothetical protein [Croceicoccus naphthovorans]